MRQQSPWLTLKVNIADEYERYMVPSVFGPWAVGLVQLAAPQTGERVLDVACGTGVVARLAAQQVGTTGMVLGLDLTAQMLNVARASVLSTDAPVGWLQASAMAMPLEDASFDVVLCQQGLQFFPDRTAALREMHRVLAPGARLALNVFRTIEHSPGYVALAEALGRHISASAGVFYSSGTFSMGEAESLHRLLIEAEFHDVQIRPAVKMLRFPSPEEFVQRLLVATPLAGAVAEADEKARAALIGEVREA